jgi:hypothetical protein
MQTPLPEIRPASHHNPVRRSVEILFQHFGIAALYIGEVDIMMAAEASGYVMKEKLRALPGYRKRQDVTR